MTDKPKRKRRVRCEHCNELFPPDELNSIPYEVEWPEDSGKSVQCHSLLCDDCVEALDEPPYGIFGPREDQIPYDSAMYRDFVGEK